MEKENCLKKIRVILINYRISANYTKNKQKGGNDKEGNTDQETRNKQKKKKRRKENNKGKPISAKRYFLDMINKLTYL